MCSLIPFTFTIFCFLGSLGIRDTSIDRGADPPSISLFTDAAKYSYAALCSLALKQLYVEDVHHHLFAEGLICSVRKHLDLPDHTDEVMFALFRGEGVQNEDVYVDLVKQEGHAFSILIVRDLVYLAVKGGKIFSVIANQLSNVY